MTGASPGSWQLVRKGWRWRDELPSSPLRWLLAPAWLAYRPLIAVRDLAYSRGWLRSHHPGLPVISIGNLSAGGTGKTPVVRLIAELLRERGERPVVLSRGYGGKAPGEGNDEAQLMGETPVICDADRRRGAVQAIAAHAATCLLLDDGFQHRRLARDCDIVLLDATTAELDTALLPLGRLREPRHALQRADLLWLTRCDLVEAPVREHLCGELASYGLPLVTSDQGAADLRPLHGGPGLAGAAIPARVPGRVLVVSAIGNPAAFERTVQRAGLMVIAAWRWEDHHRFTTAEAGAIADEARRLDASVVMTGKDAVKLAPLIATDLATTWWVLDSRPLPSSAGIACLRALIDAALTRAAARRSASSS